MGKIEEDLLKHMQIQKTQEELKEAEKKSLSFKGKLGITGVLFFLLWKFKFLLILILVKLKFILVGAKFLGIGKFFLTGGSMLLSVLIYAKQWGLPYALGFVLLIFIHELGHVLALRYYGIKASVPIFVPFVGAFVALKEMPKNVKIEAITAIAGPVLGTAGALACYGLYLMMKDPFYLSLAYVGYLINLFNLFPILPLDGGRVVGALSPKLWIIGLILCAVFLVYRPSPILLILVILSLPRFFAVFKLNKEEAGYYSIPAIERSSIGIAYFGIAAILGVLSIESHAILQTVVS